MDMSFAEFSLRYAIICAVAVVAVYLLVSLGGLVQIRMRRRAKARPLTLDGDEVVWLGPDLATDAETPRAAGAAGVANGADARRDAAAATVNAAPFSDQLFRSGVEAELQQLRGEVAGLKENLAQLKAARRVSPQYNEAMRLAQRGMDAYEIADQCGISMGEAELVLSLSRNRQEYEDHER